MRLPVLSFLRLVLLTSIVATAASAADKFQPEAWRSQMTALSTTLVDSFPFLYSAREFRDPKNRKIILRHLNRLGNTIHALPAESGEGLIGAEPLIQSARLDVRDQLNESLHLFEQKKYEAAQQKVHAQMQRCFACHTAYQVGPRFPTANVEVMKMPTQFILGKAIAFGALRQFDGALKLIEGVGFSHIDKKAPLSDDLLKLYLLVALRSEENFSRALLFIDRLNKESTLPKVFEAWVADIRAWQDLSGKKDPDKMKAYIEERKKASKDQLKDSLFIACLFESSILHKKLAAKVSSPQEKAEIFLQLGKSYSGLGFSPLGDLAKLYFHACAKVVPLESAGKECRSHL